MRKLLFCLIGLAGLAHADTTIRVDVSTDPASHQTRVATRSFDTRLGTTFVDPSQATSTLNGAVGESAVWLDVTFTSNSWRYFSAAHDAEGDSLNYSQLERRVTGGGHILEHFRARLGRNYLQAHVDQGLSVIFEGREQPATVVVPPVFIHDFLETLDKAETTAQAQNTARLKLQFGAQYLPLEPAFAAVLAVPAGSQGLLVTTVTPGSAAAQAGLQQGDVILAAGSSTLGRSAQLDQLLDQQAAGGKLSLQVWRAGGTHALEVGF